MLQLRGHAGFIVWIVFVFGPNAVEYTPVCTLELWEVDITPTFSLYILDLCLLLLIIILCAAYRAQSIRIKTFVLDDVKGLDTHANSGGDWPSRRTRIGEK